MCGLLAERHALITAGADARREGALAMFGEKYGDAVRVVTIGDYSKELCGGTHVPNSADIGLVKLLSEASIGAGVRRVEALVGLDAFRFLAREHVLLSQLAEQFKARPEELPDRIGAVVERLRAADRELDKLRASAVLSSAIRSSRPSGSSCAHRTSRTLPTTCRRSGPSPRTATE